ncbi:MAG: glutaredoxin family protein [Planctomycetia bacterium]|jgi:glutaredoxin|nr:glutaredoxin family protein [Planctomycetia bacterium]
MRILLYTRRGCHLCEEAEDLLTAHGVPAALVDVDESPEAAARYDLRVPVLEIDGQVVLEGRFQERQLAAVLADRAGPA